MSKKVLNIAERRPMLLALIIMATITIGLMFSGWLTPVPGRAQPDQPNPNSGVETTNCVTASITTNSTEATVTLSNVPPILISVGSSVNISTLALATNAVQIIDTSYTNAGNSGNDKCPDTYVTNNFAATLLTNWWTASGCGVNSNGSGLNTSSLTPTSDGQITITLNQKWEHTLDTNTDVSSIQDTIDVVCSMVTVDSLTPDLSGVYGVQGGLEDGSDPPTYWVCPCPGDVIVTASSSPSLTADQLPDCWTFTGGVEIDKLHHKVSKTDLENGPVTFTVTCGTSTETIILEADPERDAYSALIPAGTCLCDNFTDPSPFLDRCGNSLAIDCVGCDCSIIQLYIHGHFSYRYNGIWVGTCYFPAANNTFLYKTTKHNCRILRTWHLTQQPTSPTQWVVTKYDCMTGAGSLQNCRTSPTWDFNWGRPADELIDTGYPANSCENQGTPSSGNCPPYDWQ